MNCNPIITAAEFKAIHNALCELDSVCQHLENVLNREMYLKLAQARDTIRAGLQGAYDQDDAAFSAKSRHFDAVKAQLGLAHSEWSIYELDDLSDPHPFFGAKQIVYENISATIPGSTWAALWTAADACIRDSGDQHHVYVEAFVPSTIDTKTLVLRTGS